MVKTKRKIDFTEGPLFWRLLWFMLPIIATNLLQVLYDTADKVVVGRYSGDTDALAAIGSTTFVTNLIINFMIGVGAGAGVAVAQAFGAKDKRKLERCVHNAIILGLGMAVLMTVIAYSTAAPLLRLLDTKEELFDSALLYAQIIYSSILATSIYNMGASILRGVGDSSSSLTIGAISGMINVVLNLVFVLWCDMSVDGVAIATVISKYFSAVAVMVILWRRKNESYAFNPRKLIPHKGTLLRMLRLGIPTGIQSSCFSIANLASTAALNSFPDKAYIAARSIGTDIDHFTSTIAGAFLPAAMNATAQNAGANQPARIKRVFLYSLLQSAVIVGVLSNIVRLFAGDIAHIFIEDKDPDIEKKIILVEAWCGLMLIWQFLAGMLNAATGVVRGLGYSMIPLILNLIGTVGSRLIWIYGYFYPFLEERTIVEFKLLSWMYPISWGATALFIAVLCVVAFARLDKVVERRNAAKAAKAANAAASEKASSSEADAPITEQTPQSEGKEPVNT